jgi:hypothetical protein
MWGDPRMNIIVAMVDAMVAMAAVRFTHRGVHVMVVWEPSESEELLFEVRKGRDDLHGGQVDEGLPRSAAHLIA